MFLLVLTNPLYLSWNTNFLLWSVRKEAIISPKIVERGDTRSLVYIKIILKFAHIF